jgi:hypothetical protein
LTLHPGGLESYASVYQVFAENDFQECFHLAAQSFVAESFADSFSTLDTNVSGTHFVLEALRQLRPECRFYFAGSSEMFGKAVESPQTETTRFYPRSPYGISKVTGFSASRTRGRGRLPPVSTFPILLYRVPDPKHLQRSKGSVPWSLTLQVNTAHHALYRAWKINVHGEMLGASRPQELLRQYFQSHGVEPLDLLQPFRSDGELLYWDQDEHMNLPGQQLSGRLIAEAFIARYADEVER